MTPRVAWVLLATLMLPVPALGQEAAPALPLLDDVAGDVKVQSGSAPAGIPAGAVDAMDLRSLAAQETPSDFILTLALTAVDPGPAHSVLVALEYRIQFRHNDRSYLLHMYSFSGIGGAPDYAGVLEALDPGQDPNDFGAYVAEIPVTADFAAKTLSAAVPRGLLIDTQGSPPFPGRQLDAFVVEAGFLDSATIGLGVTDVPAPYIQDRMPETGVGLLPLPVQFGIAQSGSLRLASNEPFRASNGEAGTFVFRVNATNQADYEQLVEFVALGAPAAWDIRLPGLLRLPPGSSTEFPVIVRTAFAHDHGTATAFTVELVSQTDPGSVGRVQLGLRYPLVAQPAGHHNEVYLHNTDFSSNPSALAVALALRALAGGDHVREPYFNTAPEDDQDAGTPVIGQYCGLRPLDDSDVVGSTYCWEARLNPGLEMGLDFDLAATGTYSVPVHSLALQPGARVQGQLVYYAPLDDPNDPFAQFNREAIPVATLLPSDRYDMMPNSDHIFTGVVQPLPEGDLLVYTRGAELRLELEVRTGRPDNFYLGPKAEPELAPGAFLKLPLLEYEDPIDEVYGVASVVHLALDGNSHRAANPGDTMVYTITLHNADEADHDFAAALVGSNREWGRIIGAEHFGVAADGSRVLTIAVTVPTDALDNDRADLVLEVASQDDVSVRALVRLVTTADTDAEHEDQAALLASGPKAKQSPGAPFALLALALLAVVLRRR